MLPAFASVFRSGRRMHIPTCNCLRDDPEHLDGLVVADIKVVIGAGLDDDHLADLIDIGVLISDPDRSKFALRVFGEPPLLAIAEGPAAGRLLAE